MATASEVLAQLDALTKQHEAATRAHAVASSQYESAQRQVTEAEEELRKLGMNPETAEQDLRNEIARLDTAVTVAKSDLDHAMKQYAEIDAKFRATSAR